MSSLLQMQSEGVQSVKLPNRAFQKESSYVDPETLFLTSF